MDSTVLFPDLPSLARMLGGNVASGQVLAPGPGHSAADRSLAVKPDPSAPEGFVVHSFAGDDPLACKDHVRQRCGLPTFGSKRHPRASGDELAVLVANAIDGQRREKKRNVVARYDYRDETGALLYQVERFEPKSFRQRQPDGGGKWIYKLENVRRVLYRLPELLKYPDACVFVCEGEKDADRVASLDHCATTVACGDWTDDCVNALAGRDVLILEDNDEAGRKKALEAATALYGAAKTIRIVRLPNLPDKGDVSDWLDMHPNNGEKLADVCFDAPLWTPETKKLARMAAIIVVTINTLITAAPPRIILIMVIALPTRSPKTTRPRRRVPRGPFRCCCGGTQRRFHGVSSCTATLTRAASCPPPSPTVARARACSRSLNFSR